MNTLESYILKNRPYCQELGCMKESVRVLNLDDGLRTKAVCQEHLMCSSNTVEARPSNETDDEFRQYAYVGEEAKEIIRKRREQNNLSGGVESRHADLPCKHGEREKDGLMPSAHKLVQPDNSSGSSDSPAQNSLSFTESFCEWLKEVEDKG